jgi:hypothetical protein
MIMSCSSNNGLAESKRFDGRRDGLDRGVVVTGFLA